MIWSAKGMSKEAQFYSNFVTTATLLTELLVFFLTCIFKLEVSFNDIVERIMEKYIKQILNKSKWFHSKNVVKCKNIWFLLPFMFPQKVDHSPWTNTNAWMVGHLNLKGNFMKLNHFMVRIFFVPTTYCQLTRKSNRELLLSQPNSRLKWTFSLLFFCVTHVTYCWVNVTTFTYVHQQNYASTKSDFPSPFASPH